MPDTQPILYSFRRCPYAMRARLAIAISDVQVELREVVLRDKPQSLLALSAKATVPVLLTVENEVIDESLDIMRWALAQHDPDHWYNQLDNHQLELTIQLIDQNDGKFKYYLDRYKYADRYPEHNQLYYRQQAEKILQLLEHQLQLNGCLIRSTLSLADMALLPFIRQFAFVDKPWFDQSPYPHLKQWLLTFLRSQLFMQIMTKYPKWQEIDLAQFFPE